MYINHTNPVAQQSQQLISDALLRLMKRDPFSDITITAICQEADVARKTFYRCFETKEDIIDFQLDQLYQNFEQEILMSDHSQALSNYFSFKKKHGDYLTLLQKQNLIHLYQDKFIAFLPKLSPIWANDAKEQEYRQLYAIAGVIAITTRWMQQGFKESVEEITAITLRARDNPVPIDRDEYFCKNPL